MKNLILFVVTLWSCVGWSQKGASQAAAEPRSSEGKLWDINARAGFLLDTPDRAVVSKWEHRIIESYKLSIGGGATFPPSWTQWHFLGGGAFQYMTSKEELSGSYTATIDIEIWQFVIYGGVEYIPWWASGFGTAFTTGLTLFGEKSAQLDSEGFTQDLGKDEARGEFPVLISLSVFYDFGNWRPALTWESDSALTVGGSYVF